MATVLTRQVRREAAQKDLGNKELQKSEAKHKARAGTNTGENMERQQQQERENEFLRMQERGNTEPWKDELVCSPALTGIPAVNRVN